METTVETTVEAAAERTGADTPEGQLPEDAMGVLALQYEYINAGDFESAYSLFAEQSQQQVSLEQYRAFFEANAPYSVTDYSLSPAQGDSTAVEATFTVNSAAGSEQLQRTQQFVREDGEWRILMRSEQVAAFTTTSNPVSPPPAEEEGEATPQNPQEEWSNASPKEREAIRERDKAEGKTPAERGVAASEVVLRISGTPGVSYRGSFGGMASSQSGRQDVEGVIGQGQNEYRLSDIMGGDVQVRRVSAPISKAGANVEGELRTQILYQGEVVEENLATGTAGIAPVSWSPDRPF